MGSSDTCSNFNYTHQNQSHFLFQSQLLANGIAGLAVEGPDSEVRWTCLPSLSFDFPSFTKYSYSGYWLSQGFCFRDRL